MWRLFRGGRPVGLLVVTLWKHVQPEFFRSLSLRRFHDILLTDLKTRHHARGFCCLVF